MADRWAKLSFLLPIRAFIGNVSCEQAEIDQL